MFNPISDSLFFSKNDAADPRLGDWVKETKVDSPDFIIAGYPDDEGIKNNGGRIGAKEAPDKIRQFFYRMTPPIHCTQKLNIQDYGNLPIDNDISHRHETIIKEASTKIKNKSKWIGLGGGHDYGYPDGKAFLESQKDSKHRPLIINIDAHLDVRPLKDKINSGTPFYRLLESEHEFDFFEIGIQQQCNSKTHYDWCKEKSGHILSWEEIVASGEPPVTAITQFMGDHLLKPRPCFLSIDIDAFSSSFAMGCSQAWPTGFHPEDFLKVLKLFNHRLDIQVLGIYEVSPPLDQDDRTSKLAAQIIYNYIFGRSL